MNGKSSMFSMSPPFALNSSKGERRVFQQNHNLNFAIRGSELITDGGQLTTTQPFRELLVDVPHGHAVVLIVEDGFIDFAFLLAVQVIPIADHGFEGPEGLLPPVKSQCRGHTFD